MDERAIMAKYILKGVNSDANECSQCGRVELKKVVWLEPTDADGQSAGEAAPYGVNCAAKLLGFSGTKAKIDRKIGEATLQAVQDRIREIQSGFIRVDGIDKRGRQATWLYPPEALRPHRMATDEMQKYKFEKWPILLFNEGRISLDQAAKLLLD